MKRVALSIGLLLALLAAAAWLLRFRVADEVVGRRLAAAGVPAGYRITRLDPFRQRIEDVRLGDPAAPDLTARTIDVTLGYGLAGPVVRGIRADGVRLRGRIVGGAIDLGTLDRLLPRSAAGGPVLPDLMVTLADARLALATPAGAMALTLDGSGNPQRRFTGRARVEAQALRVGDCRMSGVAARLRVRASGGAPSVAGPVDVAALACPDVALSAGSIALSASADPTLARFTGTGAPSGFAGRAAAARFAGVGGRLRGSAAGGDIDLAGEVRLAALALPDAVRAVRAAPDLAGTPLSPTITRARDAAARLLARSDAAVVGALRLRDGRVVAELRQATLVGADGARIMLAARGGLGWSGDGVRIDGDLSAGGGALPRLSARLRQEAAGTPISGVARMAPYQAGGAALAVPALRFAAADGRVSFDGQARVSGPIGGGGAVTGLTLPLRGRADDRGAFSVGAGCVTVMADSLLVASVRLAAFRLPVCGSPILSRSASGTLRIDAATGPLLLRGRTGDTPVELRVAASRLRETGFTVRSVSAVLGDGPTPTRLAATEVGGGFDGGRFTGLEARIGAVPLSLDQGNGRWRLERGILRLAGALRVGDLAAEPRFRPLVADAAALSLDGGIIRADAVLREPQSRAAVMRVDIDHDLSTGRGGARLAVQDLRFTPRGLQPEAITPLTLGVVANVAGAVRGTGRVDWTSQGVTSSGRFATDGLDFAAAFGPVTGLSGDIVFTDLLGLVSAPGQVATVAEINPGVPITDGTVRYHLPGDNRIAVDEARWPFAGGTLRLEPALVDLGSDRERRLTFRLVALDAGGFVQQLELPNVSATGTFDGVLPMVFGETGGRIEGGSIAARPPGGSIAYVGPISSASIGTMGKLAFDALKAIRYSTLTIDLDGQLDGEMVSRVRFTGVRQATPDRSIVTRLLRGLPFRFNIAIRAPFRGLIGTARTYADPSLLLRQPGVQPPASGDVR